MTKKKLTERKTLLVKAKMKPRPKVSKKAKFVLPDTIPIRGLSVPKLREAYISIVDEPRRWGQTGLAMSALPKIAQHAAVLCGGATCFFCGTSQVPLPPDQLFLFHPEYPLCSCLARFRRMSFEYIEKWETPEVRALITAQVDAGTMAADTPVYQFFCPCGKGPVIVDARAIAAAIKKHQKHSRRRLCSDCYTAVVKRREEQIARAAERAKKPREKPPSRPKNGPGARLEKNRYLGGHPPFNPIKQNVALLPVENFNLGAEIPLLPTLAALEKEPEISA